MDIKNNDNDEYIVELLTTTTTTTNRNTKQNEGRIRHFHYSIFSVYFFLHIFSGFYCTLLRMLPSYSIDRWLVPLPMEPAKRTSMHGRMPHQLTTPYLKNNYVFLTFLTAFVAVNVGLFVSRAIQYRESNIYVIFARACGMYKQTLYIIHTNMQYILILYS